MSACASTARRVVVRIGVISLGCAKNLVDTEVMLGHLDRAGCTFVEDPAEADVILINTCSFIEAAREESIQTILETAELKRTGRLKRLVVAGCLVQRYPEELREQLPEVDAFIGLDELERVVESVGLEVRAERPTADPRLPVVSPGPRSARPVAPTAVAAWGAATYLYDDRTPRRRATPAWSAYIKIAEGCDHTCSFCAIPTFRGKFRSRTPESIESEARSLARQGVREINLIAQDSSHYGRDRGLEDGLPRLLERLDGIDELRWIRVHYLYPNTITNGLIETMARASRVVKYADLPLQHAHADTLRRMRRGGSAESHLRLLEKFRAASPGMALRSTFIVGFPGETKAEFDELLQFIDAARFDHLGVFSYSHEEGTGAAEQADDVPEDVKQNRHERLMARQQPIAVERNASLVGQSVLAVVEGSHADTDHLLVGRMSRQAPDVDGQVLFNDGYAKPGDFVSVELTETAGYDLVGTILGPA